MIGLAVASLVVAVVAFRPGRSILLRPECPDRRGNGWRRPVLDELADGAAPSRHHRARRRSTRHVRRSAATCRTRARRAAAGGDRVHVPGRITERRPLRAGPLRARAGEGPDRRGRRRRRLRSPAPARPSSSTSTRSVTPTRRELEMLDRDFGEWLRDGHGHPRQRRLRVPVRRVPPGYAEVMSTPGRPATGLAPTFADGRRSACSRCRAHLHDEVTSNGWTSRPGPPSTTSRSSSPRPRPWRIRSGRESTPWPVWTDREGPLGSRIELPIVPFDDAGRRVLHRVPEHDELRAISVSSGGGTIHRLSRMVVNTFEFTIALASSGRPPGTSAIHEGASGPLATRRPSSVSSKPGRARARASASRTLRSRSRSSRSSLETQTSARSHQSTAWKSVIEYEHGELLSRGRTPPATELN